MSDNLIQRSVTTQVARNLANTTKTRPHMMSITPRLLLNLLPWVQVDGGTYRVNRTRIELRGAQRIELELQGGKAVLEPSNLRSVPLFANFPDALLDRIAKALKFVEVSLGSQILQEGKDNSSLVVVVQGQAEVLSKGTHGSNLRIALLTEGEFFGETEVVVEKQSEVTIRALTPLSYLFLSSAELAKILSKAPDLKAEFNKALDGHQELLSAVNKFGEKNIDLVSGIAENVIIPETFVDYSDSPREYPLSAIQTVVRVHTRVSDLYNDPYKQLEEQLRLTVEGIKERQEWELINSKKFGLLHSVAPSFRISSRSGTPTPDDLDELLALVWKKPAFFLAHPLAIAAFERECTWRGVPPVNTTVLGVPVIEWRGVPIIPTDKLEIKGSRGVGTTSIILVRIGEDNQGVVGLHQKGIPGEIGPSLSARLMGLDTLGVASYLLTLYSSLAVLTDDALAVLENIEVGFYHEYQNKGQHHNDQGSGI